jgi:hypothetical protein
VRRGAPTPAHPSMLFFAQGFALRDYPSDLRYIDIREYNKYTTAGRLRFVCCDTNFVKRGLHL